MALEGDAADVYRLLRRRVPFPDPRITYGTVAAELNARKPRPARRFIPRDTRLAKALTRITNECRAARLPALSALVVRRKNGRPTIPGKGYFGVAHPAARTKAAKRRAWEREMDAVARTEFPRSL